jgi:hypothetical protein
VNHRLAVFIASLACYTHALRAQPAARVSLDLARLKCGIDSLEIYVVQGSARRRTGTLVDECRSSGTGSARLFTRIYRTTDRVLGNRLDTIVDLWSSLEPRSYHSVSSRSSSSDTIRLEWGGNRLRGRVALESKPAIAVDDELKSPQYNSASFDVLLRASPLAAGYSVDVPAYVPGRGVLKLTAKVVGEEDIAGQASWRVNADYGGLSVTFWIAKTSRQLLKQAMHITPEADIEFVSPPARRS